MKQLKYDNMKLAQDYKVDNEDVDKNNMMLKILNRKNKTSTTELTLE